MKDWVTKSTDRHKAELTSVLFPIFVHCYLGLIKHCDPSNNEQACLARKFLHRWGPEHQLHYPDEVISLQSIAQSDDLETHEFAKLLLAFDPVSTHWMSTCLSANVGLFHCFHFCRLPKEKQSSPSTATTLLLNCYIHSCRQTVSF